MHVRGIALLLLTLWTTPIAAQSLGELRQQLDRIERDSVQLRARIDSARTKSVSIQNQADRSEKAIIEANRHMDELEKELISQQHKRNHVEEELEALNAQFQSAREEMKALIVAEYKQFSISEMRHWVGAKSVADRQQIARWNEIINTTLKGRVTELATNIERGYNISAQLDSAHEQLSDELARITQHREILNNKLRSNLTELGNIKSSIQLSEAQLAGLQRDKNRLTNLIDKIVEEQSRRQQEIKLQKKSASTQQPRKDSQAVVGAKAVYQLPAGSFAKSRGKMGLPVAGRLIASYGAKNSTTGLRSDGITLRSAKGARVNAIFAGKVVYAGFFKGYGQMVIIDHQGDFLSLYTLDGNLSVVEGQNVDMGSAIGRMAANGNSQVYLEIRKGKQTVDPLQWCRKDSVATKIN